MMEELKTLSKNSLIGFVIAKDQPKRYIQHAKSPLSKFLQFMIKDLEHTLFDGKVFFADGHTEDVEFSTVGVGNGNRY